jgi:two-component sensor histidine kinase
MRDISERRKREAQVQLLLREVNHRAKNMLSLVQAVARQTLAANPNDFMVRFSERIQALAASQDLLVKNAWKGVDLGELARSQLAHFSGLIDNRIEVAGEPIVISSSAAQSIGMALHELATNAGEYGALSNGSGRVRIDWKISPRDDRFTLRWCETGGPAVEPPSRKGFGSIVIAKLIEANLKGKVDLDFSIDGFRWKIECDMSAICDGLSSTAKPIQEKTPLPAEKSSRKIRVLVVEDNAFAALDIADVLSEAGFDVLGPAGSVAKTIDLVQQNTCDAAVLDINLGDETSEQVAQTLKQLGIPFITLSGYLSSQQPSVFQEVATLSKPLQPSRLITEIKRCVMPKSDLNLLRENHLNPIRIGGHL